MSIGGGSQKQKSSSTQESSSESQNYGSNVWGAQSPFLQDLYARAQVVSGDPTGTAAANQYLAGANQNLGMAGQSLAGSNQALQGFLNPGQDPAVAAYAQNLGQQFNEQFLPGLQGDAIQAGGLGGSRQQIGAALGSQRAMQTLGDFTAQTYAGQQDRALQAAQGLAGNAQGYESLAGTGLATADFARGMPWYQLAQYQGLLGSPVMQDLGGYSKSKGTGTSSGSGSGWNANAGLKG